MEKFNCPSCKYEFEKGVRDIVLKGDELPIRLYLSNSIRLMKQTN